MILPLDFKEFIELAISADLKFVIVGGWAVNMLAPVNANRRPERDFESLAVGLGRSYGVVSRVVGKLNLGRKTRLFADGQIGR